MDELTIFTIHFEQLDFRNTTKELCNDGLAGGFGFARTEKEKTQVYAGLN